MWPDDSSMNLFEQKFIVSYRRILLFKNINKVMAVLMIKSTKKYKELHLFNKITVCYTLEEGIMNTLKSEHVWSEYF